MEGIVRAVSGRTVGPDPVLVCAYTMYMCVAKRIEILKNRFPKLNWVTWITLQKVIQFPSEPTIAKLLTLKFPKYLLRSCRECWTVVKNINGE